MSVKEENEFLKKHSVITNTIGELTIETELKVVDNLPKTTVAMSNVAKAEEKDDIIRRNGRDDYRQSLGKLFDAFDTFIREYSSGKSKAGIRGNYNLSVSCDLTIFLLWQIRHTWTHGGGLIDAKCKQIYENTLKRALEGNIKPIINLPKELKVDYEFIIDFENYKAIKKCIFTYIGRKIPKEDLKILSNRSSLANFEISAVYGIIDWGFGYLKINLEEAYKCGCEFDIKTKMFTLPSHAIYDAEMERVRLVSSGESFSAKRLETHEKQIFKLK